MSLSGSAGFGMGDSLEKLLKLRRRPKEETRGIPEKRLREERRGGRVEGSGRGGRDSEVERTVSRNSGRGLTTKEEDVSEMSVWAVEADHVDAFESPERNASWNESSSFSNEEKEQEEAEEAREEKTDAVGRISVVGGREKGDDWIEESAERNRISRTQS